MIYDIYYMIYDIYYTIYDIYYMIFMKWNFISTPSQWSVILHKIGNKQQRTCGETVRKTVQKQRTHIIRKQNTNKTTDMKRIDKTNIQND